MGAGLGRGASACRLLERNWRAPRRICSAGPACAHARAHLAFRRVARRRNAAAKGGKGEEDDAAHGVGMLLMTCDRCGVM